MTDVGLADFVMSLFLYFSFLFLFFYTGGKIEEYFDRKNEYKKLIELRNKKREERKEEKEKKFIKVLYDVQTEYMTEEFKRNPELWRQLIRDFKGTPHMLYLLDRYTVEENGKRYWRY